LTGPRTSPGVAGSVEFDGCVGELQALDADQHVDAVTVDAFVDDPDRPSAAHHYVVVGAAAEDCGVRALAAIEQIVAAVALADASRVSEKVPVNSGGSCGV